MDRGTRLHSQFSHREHDESQRQAIGTDGGSGSVRADHDARDLLLLEESGCNLRDPHPLVRRRLFIPLWHHPEGESFSLVESVEDVVRSDCVRRVQFVGHHWVVHLLPDVRHLRVVSCREHLMRISDADYVLHAIIVSVICGLTETLTIPNYDNITVSVVCVLLYDYIQKK